MKKPTPKESTSEDVAAVAALGLKHPKRLTKKQIKMVCASALTQYENKNGG